MSTKNMIDALEGLESPSLTSVCKSTPSRGQYRFGPRYRTIDGSRNRRHPNLGRANTPFRRLLRADYGDGMSRPRKANGGSELPNARLVSKTLFDNKNNPSKQLSHMAMIWGQFLDHDITQSAESEVDCTGKCGLSGECFGISIPAGDNAFKSCIEVVRNVAFCHRRKLRREQINTLSSFIDASAVYSNDEKKFESLRDPKDSALLIERKKPFFGGKKLLTPDKEGFCRSPKPKTRPCFLAGDARVNENSGLASMHTIWNREHNRIVKRLRKINPRLRKKEFRNKLFFVARKIVGAMVQHITYNEFLPAILSEQERTRFRLRLKPYFFLRRFSSRRYRPNPSIFNSFATAAYRFGHSLVQNQLNRFSNFGKRESLDKKKSPIPMDRFFDTSALYSRSGVDSILRGLARDKAQQVDGSFAQAVHEKLRRFEEDLADLPAINVQRGREHGIPGYNSFRKRVGLKKAKNFDDLKDVMTADQINNLKKVYTHVDDIDLFVGGVYEKAHEGGAVGKTFSFIIAKQFHNLRFGDRFWYENHGEFTYSQLQEIRKSSLARVICDNSNRIKRIYKKVMEKKMRIQCKHLPSVNLKKWAYSIRHYY